MRVKFTFLNNIVTVGALSILLLFVALAFPSSPIRIVLGIPFLLFAPGYALISVLFTKGPTGPFERAALSLGGSVLAVAAIGFGLNYSPWGITLESVLGALSIFVVVVSNVAIIRRFISGEKFNFLVDFELNLVEQGANPFNQSLNVFLVVLVIAAVGVLGYSIFVPKNGEKFSEFYVLGYQGKAELYPSDFILEQGAVSSVSYGTTVVSASEASIKVGIINHQQIETLYFVKMFIDGQQINLHSGSTTVNQIGPLVLKDGEANEQVIGFSPTKLGDGQKVELELFEGSSPTPKDSLHFWINVRGTG